MKFAPNTLDLEILPFWLGLTVSGPSPLKKSERRRGWLTRVLGCGVDGRRFESRLGQKTGKLSLSTQQQMGIWLTSGKVKGSERRGLGLAFHMPCPRHEGALTSHCPNSHKAKGTFTFTYVLQCAEV